VELNDEGYLPRLMIMVVKCYEEVQWNSLYDTSRGKTISSKINTVAIATNVLCNSVEGEILYRTYLLISPGSHRPRRPKIVP
jgi:hypothetical protein